MDKQEEMRQWIAIADKDFTAAEYMAKNMWPVPDEIICFHCQQCACASMRCQFRKAKLCGLWRNIRVALAWSWAGWVSQYGGRAVVHQAEAWSSGKRKHGRQVSGSAVSQYECGCALVLGASGNSI